MPNRIIKESIRTSKSVNQMTDFQFRLWIYLITYVDDYGRGSADPELLKGLVFPRMKRVREQDIASALAELAGKGAILLYEVDGEPLFYFPNWSEHQRIQTKRSKFPDPPAPTEIPAQPQQGTEIHGDSPWPTVAHGYNLIQKESESISESEVCVPRTRGKNTRGEKAPTLDDVKSYAASQGLKINDPERFIAYNTGKGWPMKWQEALRLWCTPRSSPARELKDQQYNQREYTHTDDAADALMGGLP